MSLITLLTFLVGCRQDETIPDLDVESLYFEAIGMGYAAEVPDTTTVILHTESDWAEFRKLLHPRRPFKEADFEQTMVLVAAVPVSTGGYTVEFESVERIGGEVIASYLLTQPGYDCMAIMALTQPFEAIAVRRTDGPVRFVRRSKTESCSSS